MNFARSRLTLKRHVRNLCMPTSATRQIMEPNQPDSRNPARAVIPPMLVAILEPLR